MRGSVSPASADIDVSTLSFLKFKSWVSAVDTMIGADTDTIYHEDLGGNLVTIQNEPIFYMALTQMACVNSRGDKKFKFIVLLER